MFCPHCPALLSNRNSFNRHLRGHLGTDVAFLKTKLQQDQEDRSCKPEISKNQPELNTKKEPLQASAEDVNDILQRYQHLKVEAEEVADTAETNVSTKVIEENEEKTEMKDVKAVTVVNVAKNEKNELETKELSKDNKDRSKMNKSVSCQDCDKKMSNRHNLKRHVLTYHTDSKTKPKIPLSEAKKNRDKKVQCDICEKMFATKGVLLTHKQTHTGKKKYACQNCEDSYKTLKELNSHQTTSHTAGA